MSLINEALKKAQRQRHHEAPAAPGAPADSGPVAKRPQPKSAKSMLVLAAGGVLLAVVSMVLTALWLTRPASPAPTPAREVAPVATAAVPEPGSSPSVVVPALTPPVPAAAPVAVTNTGAGAKSAVPPASVASTPPATPAAAAAAEKTPSASPVAKTTPAATPAPAPEPAAPPKPDERISQFVDALRVTGIRSSGNESKVLMNDRVYRVNDLVDRVLGVRLTKVSSDSLTFADANGATYVKNF